MYLRNLTLMAAVLMSACSMPSGPSAPPFVPNLARTFHDIQGKFKLWSTGSNSYPYEMTASGKLYWFTEKNTDNIASITTAGVITTYGVPTQYAQPAGITVGPDGAIWFAELSGNNIGRLSASGSIQEFSVPSSYACPYRITSGPDGDLWFTENCANKIGRLNPKTNIFTEYALASGAAPGGIASGPGGLWFCEEGGHAVGVISTSGKIKLYSVNPSASVPDDIAQGYDKLMWFTDYGDNSVDSITTKGKITPYTVPTSEAIPLIISKGPDEALWFSENATTSNNIGEIITKGTATGKITEYTVPGSGSLRLRGIASGADKAVWFTAPGINSVGRLK